MWIYLAACLRQPIHWDLRQLVQCTEICKTSFWCVCVCAVEEMLVVFCVPDTDMTVTNEQVAVHVLRPGYGCIPHNVTAYTGS